MASNLTISIVVCAILENIPAFNLLLVTLAPGIWICELSIASHPCLWSYRRCRCVSLLSVWPHSHHWIPRLSHCNYLRRMISQESQSDNTYFREIIIEVLSYNFTIFLHWYTVELIVYYELIIFELIIIGVNLVGLVHKSYWILIHHLHKSWNFITKYLHKSLDLWFNIYIHLGTFFL